MTDETPHLRRLHDIYTHKTGLVVQFTFSRLHAWQLWKARGWLPEDLSLVVAHVKKLIAAGRKWDSALSFRNLIENTDNFEELLADARARARLPVVDRGRREALRATGRFEQPKAAPRSAEQVMRDEAAFQKFKEWRQANGL